MRTFQPGRNSKPTIEVAEAQRLVLEASEALEAEPVALHNLDRRVIAEPIIAIDDQPHRDNSAMDGYAVASADLTGDRSILRIDREIPAGREPDESLSRGSAVRIMTGAPIPAGADAVIPVEQTEEKDGFVTIKGRVSEGSNIRRRGEEYRAGTRLIEPGVTVDAGVIATIATANLTAAFVHRAPEVAILVTGSEIGAPGADRTGATVIDSNSPMLLSLLRREACVVSSTKHVADDLHSTVKAFQQRVDVDVVISTGGVSAGAYDFVQDALVEIGAEVIFWKVAMRPGKPVLFAKKNGTLYFALPGNPASVFVAFHLFVAPALRKLAGHSNEMAMPRTVNVVLAERAASKSDRPSYLRARVMARDGILVASIPHLQGSGMTSSLAGCNALIRVEGASRGEPGESVSALLLGPVT